MKNKIFMFALGAAAGSLVTWKLIEKKYKEIADEEIASMSEYYHEKLNKEVIENEEARDVEFDVVEEKEEHEELVEDLEYTAGLATIEEDTEGIFETKADIREYVKPYVITPEEFGEFGNETKSLTYYSDFVLVDEEGDIIADPEAVIGDALEHFGEYEDDAVHVRDENIECDYEILKHEKTFSEVYKEEN